MVTEPFTSGRSAGGSSPRALATGRMTPIAKTAAQTSERISNSPEPSAIGCGWRSNLTSKTASCSIMRRLPKSSPDGPPDYNCATIGPMNADSPLQTPVQFLKGVGPDRARLLANLDLVTVEDLLWNLPRDVLDLTNVCRASELRAGELQTVRGTVMDRDGRTTGTGRTMVGVLIESDGLYVRGLWFNQPWMIRKFEVGEAVLFSGKPKRNAG